MSKLYAGLSVLKDGSFSFEDALLYYTDTPLSYFIIEAILKRYGNEATYECVEIPYKKYKNFKCF